MKTVGIDIAKDVFQVHGVDERGHIVCRRRLQRRDVLRFFRSLDPCLIGMEACASAHYWARELVSIGHDVRLIAPQFVKPYVKSNKTDRADAEAICEAVGRPNMRFVPIKSTEQQAVLALHAVRSGFIRARTACANQIRGLLAEFGIVLRRGAGSLVRELPRALTDSNNNLPYPVRDLLQGLLSHWRNLDAKACELEQQIQHWHRDNELSRRIAAIPGVGPLTASAIVAHVGNAQHFARARQFAAWLGLVPRQHSSGGKERLLGISKRGDRYLRTLLIHGARVLLRYRGTKATLHYKHQWATELMSRRHKNVGAVALANKHARIIWALLSKGCEYQPSLNRVH
jgi:transposase